MHPALRLPLRLALPFALLAALPASAGEVVVDQGRYRFNEDFRWSGNHGATIGTAPNLATTVWWDEDDWDARCDSALIAVEPLTDDGIDMTNRFHVDIHKAMAADPHDGRISNTANVVGGDGSPGIGIMHLDYQDICGARLRNPMRITPQQPAVVTFYGPLFNTTGHWIELALTPADGIVGSEHTSVPSVDSGLPFPGSNVSQPGPGHDTNADSLNLIFFGTADYPCRPGPGWRTRFGVSKSIGGVKTHFVTPGATQNDFLPTDPGEANTLVEWRAEFATDHVALSYDPEGDGTFTPLESWPATVPWEYAHLHLVSVAYQSSHHPDDECNLGHIREVQWRDVSAYPVRYARTAVFPKNDGTNFVPKQLGFTAYDLRDIQRFGVVDGVPQANAVAYTYHHPGRYCVDGGFPCFSGAPAAPVLSYTLPAGVTDGLVAANLVADLKDAAPPALHPGASATMNGVALGRMPEHDAVLDGDGEWSDWVRRGLAFAPDAVKPGANTLTLALEAGAYVDRVEIELLYGTAGPDDGLFSNGFEGDDFVSLSWRNPDAGKMGLAVPRVPLTGKESPLHQCAE